MNLSVEMLLLVAEHHKYKPVSGKSCDHVPLLFTGNSNHIIGHLYHTCSAPTLSLPRCSSCIAHLKVFWHHDRLKAHNMFQPLLCMWVYLASWQCVTGVCSVRMKPLEQWRKCKQHFWLKIRTIKAEQSCGGPQTDLKPQTLWYNMYSTSIGLVLVFAQSNIHLF